MRVWPFLWAYRVLCADRLLGGGGALGVVGLAWVRAFVHVGFRLVPFVWFSCR